MSLSLPDDYVGLASTDPAALIEHAEQVQRNFETIARQSVSPFDFPALPSPRRMLLLSGLVTAAGAIQFAGTGGWTVARTAGAPVGDYTVTVTTPFTDNAVMQITTTAAVALPSWLAITATTARYQMLTAAGALVDAAASFYLLGSV